MQGLTFKDLAKAVLEESGNPMTADQIWDYAVAHGYADQVGSHGKTPERSIQAQLYVDLRENGEESPFVQTQKNPVMFVLRANWNGKPYIGKPAVANPEQNGGEEPAWQERDLHPLLTTYVRSDGHFHCRTRTIFHESSKKRSRNSDKWSYPDLVGIYFPFDEYEESTIRLIETLRENPFRIFSFEMKKRITQGNFREYFFQAVSNSSWANEGYLVAPSIAADPDFRDDMQRLVNAFGIGVIHLDIANIEQSEILFSATRRDQLDWATVDRLAGQNPDFAAFIEDVVNDAKTKSIRGRYDESISADDYEGYLKGHQMIQFGTV